MVRGEAAGGAKLRQTTQSGRSAATNTALRAPSDAQDGDEANDTVHLAVWHDTITGHDAVDRYKLFYDDIPLTVRSHLPQSCVNDVDVQINTKHNRFADASRNLADAFAREKVLVRLGAWASIVASARGRGWL